MTSGSQRIEAGELDLGDLPQQWAIQQALARHYADLESTWADYEGLSSRAIDERLPAGHRGYMAAHRCLSAAMDNHEALIALLEHHGATNFAPWNLLRPTFEAAFYAAWLLEPQETLARRQRGLRFEWLDEVEHRKHYENLRSLPIPTHLQPEADAEWSGHLLRIEKHDGIYRAEAALLALPFPMPDRLNVTKELRQLQLPSTSPETRSVALVSSWWTLSGLQHGRASTMLRATDKMDDGQVAGGWRATLSLNDEAFVREASMTCTLHIYALTLALRRHLPPGAPLLPP